MLCVWYSGGIALAWMSCLQPVKLRSICFTAVDCEHFTPSIQSTNCRQDSRSFEQQMHIKCWFTTSLLHDECHCANVFSCDSCNWQRSQLNYVGQRDEQPYCRWRWETVQDVKLEEKVLLAFETILACYTRIKSLLWRLERHRKTIAQRQLRRLFPSNKPVAAAFEFKFGKPIEAALTTLALPLVCLLLVNYVGSDGYWVDIASLSASFGKTTNSWPEAFLADSHWKSRALSSL
jgi:hypothetical protein